VLAHKPEQLQQRVSGETLATVIVAHFQHDAIRTSRFADLFCRFGLDQEFTTFL
jgi:hypothetical protein